MPPIQKPKPNFITKAAEKVKAASPFPDWLNNAVLPTDQSLDVAGIPAGGAIEPAVQAGSNLISPLVSMYKNKAEREAATKAFYDSVVEFSKKFIPHGEYSGWAMAAKDLTKTHPRVAAHMISDEAPHIGTSNLTTTGDFAAVMDWHPIANKTGPGPVILHRNAIENVADDTAYARAVMRHEATHAAQALGDPHVPELYNIAHEAVGYQANPYERGARYGEPAALVNAKSSAVAPMSSHQQQAKLARQLQKMGISLDTIGAGGGRPAELSLRKWGMPKEPENMIDIKTIPEPLRSKLQDLHQALSGTSNMIPSMRTVRGTSPGKASDTMRQILETRRTGQPNLTRAYQYLARRTGQPIVETAAEETAKVAPTGILNKLKWW